MNASTLPPRRSRHRTAGRRLHWPRLALVVGAALAIVASAVGVLRAGGLRPLVTDLLGRALAVAVRQPDPASVARLRSQDPVTVLVLGLETAPQYAGPQLTDSMMVWGFDPTTKRAQILSVPRDLWVDIPGFGPQRINTAFEFGGPATAELAVERYVGVPVEYYAIVNYAAFVKLVNDVGGIDVNVPYAINDTCYPNPQENRCTVYRLAKGPHHMDGAQALMFARERHSLPQSDLTRESDQQIVLLALKNALLRPQTLLHLPAIVGDMSRLVTTNLPYADLPRLAASAIRLPRADIASAVLGVGNAAVTPYTTSGGADVLLPQASVIHRVVAGLFGPELGHVGTATVQVEDGAPTTQPLATYFSRVLDGMGVHTLPAEQAARTDRATNHVYWNTAAPGAAATPRTLAYMLSAMLDTRLTTRAVPTSRAALVVVLGKSFPKVQP